MQSLPAGREAVTLKHRLEECEQASALANGGCLTIPIREVQLNLKKLVANKRVLPWQLEASLCERWCKDAMASICDMAYGDTAKSEAPHYLLLESLIAWTPFLQNEEEASALTVVRPTFSSLVAKFADCLAMPDEDSYIQEGKAEVWKAGFTVGFANLHLMRDAICHM